MLEVPEEVIVPVTAQAARNGSAVGEGVSVAAGCKGIFWRRCTAACYLRVLEAWKGGRTKTSELYISDIILQYRMVNHHASTQHG